MARKKKKAKRTWTKTTMRMKENHTWKAPKGYKIFVIDRGAASFNIPQSWVIGKFEPLEINDAEPPDDNARLSVTVMNFPKHIDWSGLPLMHLFAQALKSSAEDEPQYEILERKEIVRVEREDLEMLWTEHKFIDPIEKREAFSRITIARGSGV
ncbi:MAG: hypothetical protein D6737_02820, partial [Chloroflexi bacterium]